MWRSQIEDLKPGEAVGDIKLRAGQGQGPGLARRGDSRGERWCRGRGNINSQKAILARGNVSRRAVQRHGPTDLVRQQQRPDRRRGCRVGDVHNEEVIVSVHDISIRAGDRERLSGIKIGAGAEQGGRRRIGNVKDEQSLLLVEQTRPGARQRNRPGRTDGVVCTDQNRRIRVHNIDNAEAGDAIGYVQVMIADS